MKKLLSLIMLIPGLVKSQVEITNDLISDRSKSERHGIQWTYGLSWEQIKAKAKVESKYIFVDCFATWCGPCKKMDRDVYENQNVGNFINDRFLSVKVQMDKTKNDNDFTKSWYNDAILLNKQYRILAYPTFIFFSPEGNVVHMEKGYKSVEEFIDVAKVATVSGKKYDNPFAVYDKLVEDYYNGKKDYNKMVYMIKTAFKIGDKDFALKLLNEHTDYVAKIKERDRYTKENIELWSSLLLSSTGKRFVFFYNDAKKIDKVMKEKGYSQAIIDRTIQHEIVKPFYEKQPGASSFMGSQLVMNDPNGDSKIDSSEAEWEALFEIISLRFNKTVAKRNVLEAKLLWYQKHNNWQSFSIYYLKKLRRMHRLDPQLNNRAWDIFMNVTNRQILNEIIPWMRKVVDKYPKDAGAIDTYANLLYKIGQQQEAMQWERKAVEAEKNDYKRKEYIKVVEQMKQGLSTYGAVWK